jgi:PAS domain S-box-containing protein
MHTGRMVAEQSITRRMRSVVAGGAALLSGASAFGQAPWPGGADDAFFHPDPVAWALVVSLAAAAGWLWVRRRMERARGARARREWAVRFQLARRGAGLGGWTLDVPRNRLRLDAASRAWAGLTADHDWPLEEWFERLHPEDLESVREALREHVEGRAPRYEVLSRRRSAGGTWRWVRAAGEAVERDREGRATRVVGIYEDLDDEVRGEDRLARLDRTFLGFGTDPMANIQRLVGEAGSTLGGCAALYNRLEGDDLVVRGAWRAQDLLHQKSPAAGHICSDLIRQDTRWTKVIRDLKHTLYAETDAAVRAMNLETYAGHVVRVQGEALGTICVLFRHDRDLSEAELGYLGLIAAAAGVEEMRGRSEAKVREAELRYRTLVEQLPAISYIVDLFPAPRTVYISPQVDTILGYGQTEWCRDPGLWIRRIHDEDRDRIVRDVLLHNETGAPFFLEYRALTRDGRIVWFRNHAVYLRDAAGKPNQVHGVMLDVSQRKWAEERLRSSEARYRSIFNSTGTAMAIVEEDLTVSLFNEEFRQIFSLREDDVMGNAHWIERCPPDDQERIRRHHAERMRDSSGAPPPFEFSLRTGERVMTLTATVNVLPGSRKTVISLLDVTARREAEEQLAESNARLNRALREIREKERQVIQQERLSALGQMASGVAHDFNNALQPILLTAGMMQHDPSMMDNAEAMKELVNVICDSAEAAKNTVDRLVRFYKPSEEPMQEVFDLSNLVRDVVAITRPKWRNEPQSKGRHIELKTTLTRRCLVAGQYGELRESLINLVFNAVDALEEGGVIYIRTVLKDRRCVVEVSDDGPGMPEEVRRRCMEPFFTTKQQRGSGLGLSIVYGIVNSHGGSMEIDSEPGRGTAIRLALPLAEEPPEKMTEIRRGLSGDHVKASRPLNILFVDDDAFVLKTMKASLALKGHTVETMPGADAALARFRNGSFDLVITDQAMSGMTGSQLASRIRDIDPDMPVILVTGFGDLLDLGEEDASPFAAVLGKPVSIDVLQEKINRLFDPAPAES